MPLRAGYPCYRDFTDALALHAIRLIGCHLRRAYANGQDLEAWRRMLLVSCVAGTSFTRASLGAVHGLAHAIALSSACRTARPMGYCCRMSWRTACRRRRRNSVTSLWSWERMCSTCPTLVAARQAVTAVEALPRDTGIPHTLRDLGITAADVPAIVNDAVTYRRISTAIPAAIGWHCYAIVADERLVLKKSRLAALF